MEMFNGWIIVPEEDSQTFYSSWTIPLGLGVWVHDKKKKINLSMNDGFTRAKSEINTGSI